MHATFGEALRIQPVITGFKRTNTPINLIAFAAVQMPASFGAAAVRYDLYDAKTGQLVGQITSSRAARPWNVYPWNVLKNFQSNGQGAVLLKASAKTLRKDTVKLAAVQPALKGNLIASIR